MVPTSYFEAQVPSGMAISNDSSNPSSPFRSTKLNSGLTVMSSLTMSVIFPGAAFTNSPETFETCDAAGLGGGGLQPWPLCFYSDKGENPDSRGSVVGKFGSPSLTSTSLFMLAMSASECSSASQTSQREISELRRVRCGFVVFTAELHGDQLRAD